MKKRWIFILMISLVVICATLLLLWYNDMKKLVEQDVIYNGLYLNGYHLGGMTQKEAIEYAEADFYKNYASRQLTLFLNNNEAAKVSYDFFSFEGDYEKVIEEMYAIGKEGKIRERYKIIKTLQNNLVDYHYKAWYDNKKIYDYLDKLAKDFYIKPENATIQRVNREFIIEEEKIGQELSIEGCLNNISEALNQCQDKALLVVMALEPQVTSEYLKSLRDLLGSSYTEFNTANQNRCENLRVASSYLDGITIQPGEIFSTYEAIGPVTAARGYQTAPVIINNELIPGIGGGVCQIATTLYNAVLMAELKVVERKNHSMPVSYVEKGRDATLAEGYIDFRFENNTKNPIYLESYIEGNRLYMNLFSHDSRDKNRIIAYESRIINVTQPGEPSIIIDSALAPGEKIIDSQAMTGYTVDLYKKVYVNGELTGTEKVNTSYYKSKEAVIRIGPED